MKTIISTIALVAATSAAMASNPPASPLLTDLVNNRAAIEAELDALQAWADTNSGPDLCVPWGDLAGACSNVSEIYGVSIDFPSLTIAVQEGVNVITPITVTPTPADGPTLYEAFQVYNQAKAVAATTKAAVAAAYDFDDWWTTSIAFGQMGICDTCSNTLAVSGPDAPVATSGFGPQALRFLLQEYKDTFDAQYVTLLRIETAIAEADTAWLQDLRVEYKGRLGLGAWDALPSGLGFDGELDLFQYNYNSINAHYDNQETVEAAIEVWEEAKLDLANATIDYVAAANAAGITPEL